MITIQELVDTYEKNSNEELLAIYADAGNYTGEALEALQMVIDKRGGIEELRIASAGKRALAVEEMRIRNEAAAMFKQRRVSPGSVKGHITSTIFSEKEVSDMVDDTAKDVHLEREDRAINPRTIIGSTIGGFVGGTLGGGIWGLWMIQTNRITPLIGLGVYILNFALVRYFTRQTGQNKIVLVASLLYTAYAFGVGMVMVHFFR